MLVIEKQRSSTVVLYIQNRRKYYWILMGLGWLL
jgi:hypothetical protein